MSSKFIHVVSCISIPFLFITKYCSIVWTYHISCIPSSADGTIWLFLKTIMNNAAIKIHVQVSVWTHAPFLLDIYLGVEFLGQVVNSLLNHFRNWQFFKAVAPFHIHTSSVWGFQFLPILANIWLSNFLFPAILVDGKLYLTMILVCTSLMTNNVKHFSHVYWTFVSSLEKCLFRSFAHF